MSQDKRNRFIQDSSKGFTLIELIIAMTILTMIALILGFAMRLGIKSVEKSEAKIEYLERTRASLRIIESQLQSFVPLTYDDMGKRYYYFKGQEDNLSFMSSVSLWGRQSGMIQVTYEVIRDRDDDSMSLVVQEESAYTKETRSTVLLKNFKEISFNFFVKKPEDKEGDWSKGVEGADNVPLWVSLTADSSNFKIEMMIPIRARASITMKNPPSTNIFGGISTFK
ncbi:MAG: type II secretion system protein [Nitrospirae bacterium]|nr:type II secretion system protein [Nitrospirota bacterium]